MPRTKKTNEIYIDCYGKSYRSVISVQVGAIKVHFVFDEEQKHSLRFHLALFVDYHALTNGYLGYSKSRRACLLAEPRASHHFRTGRRLGKRFSHVFTHDRLLLESSDDRYVPLLYGTNWIGWDEKRLDKKEFQKKKILSFVGALHLGADGGHGFRNQIIETLLYNGQADCYGKGIKYIESKIDGLADYAFSVSMENTQQDFYFTEKINDCFLAETVPVYWGCPAITRFFDSRGMLLFNTYEEFLRIVDGLNMDLYVKMRPFVLANKQKTIENRWHSFLGYYKRVAEAILLRYDLSSPVFLRLNLAKYAAKIKRSLRI